MVSTGFLYKTLQRVPFCTYLIQPFLQGEKSLQLEAEYFKRWLPSIQDTAQIIGILPRTWQTVANQVSGRITCNVSYPLSEYLAGADAQIIAGNTLIDVRTSAKKRPFSLDNFYQQISYVLLDSNDTYGINQLVWFYSRHQAALLLKLCDRAASLKENRTTPPPTYTYLGYALLNMPKLSSRCDYPSMAQPLSGKD